MTSSYINALIIFKNVELRKWKTLEKNFEINLGVKMARIGVNRSNKK